MRLNANLAQGTLAVVYSHALLMIQLSWQDHVYIRVVTLKVIEQLSLGNRLGFRNKFSRSQAVLKVLAQLRFLALILFG